MKEMPAQITEQKFSISKCLGARLKKEEWSFEIFF